MLPGFLNIWMLFGSLLIGVPIVIHFFNRSNFKTVPWGAMMFLKKAVQVRSQRIRIEQIILLILRSLFFILLALALARPVINSGTGSFKDPTTHIIIIDNSYSMQQGEEENSAFQMARKAALKIIDNMRSSDNMIIILGGKKPELIFPNMSFDKKFLRKKINDLKPGMDEAMNIPKILARVYWILERSSLPHHRVYILTDCQRLGWHAEEISRWKKLKDQRDLQEITPFTYVLKQRPDNKIKNVAVLRIYPQSPVVDVFRPAKFFVEICNYTSDKRMVQINFYVDGKLLGNRDINCPPGISTVQFDYSFKDQITSNIRNGASSHYVTAEIEEDDLIIDNKFNLALEVRHSIPVLIVEGRDSEAFWDSDGGLISLALNSAGKIKEKSGLFKIVRKNYYELETQGIDALQLYKVIILADVPSFSRNFQFALERFVEHGGGLFVCLGKHIYIEEYNKIFGEGRGLLPAGLIKIQSSDIRPYNPSFPAGKASHILDVFDVTRTRVLHEVLVKKFWDSNPAKDAQVIGFFNDAPFLVYRDYGEGRVALWTTSINTEWTNFPLTQDYLPLLQNLVIYLSASIQPPVNLNQGDKLVVTLPVTQKSIINTNLPDFKNSNRDAVSTNTIPLKNNKWNICNITDPTGGVHEVEAAFIGGEWIAEWTETMSPGIYKALTRNMPSKFYSVTFHTGEGDLSILQNKEQKHLKKTVITKFVNNYDEMKTAIGKESGTKEWWRKLIYLTLLLLCLELYLAWRYNG